MLYKRKMGVFPLPCVERANVSPADFRLQYMYRDIYMDNYLKVLRRARRQPLGRQTGTARIYFGGRKLCAARQKYPRV